MCYKYIKVILIKYEVCKPHVPVSVQRRKMSMVKHTHSKNARMPRYLNLLHWCIIIYTQISECKSSRDLEIFRVLLRVFHVLFWGFFVYQFAKPSSKL